MKTSVILAAFVALAATQTLSDIPPCSNSCLISGMRQVGCAADDIRCACSANEAIGARISSCLDRECTPAEQLTFYKMAISTCESVGIPIGPVGQKGWGPVMRHEQSDGTTIDHAFWATVMPKWLIKNRTVSTYIDTYSPTSFTDALSLVDAYPTSLPDTPTDAVSCVTSTVTLTRTVAVTSQVPVQSTSSSPIATTAADTATGISASTTDLPTFTGAAVVGAGIEGAVAAGLVGLLGLVV